MRDWGPNNTSGNAVNTAAVMRHNTWRWPTYVAWQGGWRATGSVANSYHPRGKANDIGIVGWETPAGIARGNEISQFFIDNRNVYGVIEIIWRSKIWTPSRGWVDYNRDDDPDRLDNNLQHRDHIHLSLASGINALGVAKDKELRNALMATVIRTTKARSSNAGVLFRTVLTADAESDMRNLANMTVPESMTHALDLALPPDWYGTSDNSTGLFQQRAPWWKTYREQMDPVQSTNLFLDAYLRETRVTDDPVRDIWFTQKWGAPNPDTDLAGFRAAPQTQNYTRRLGKIQQMIDNPNYFTTT